MYEKPELTVVGEAQDTILGIAIDGCDFDCTYQWTPTPPPGGNQD